MLRESL
jgi:dynein heavy chain